VTFSLLDWRGMDLLSRGVGATKGITELLLARYRSG